MTFLGTFVRKMDSQGIDGLYFWGIASYVEGVNKLSAPPN